MDAQAIAIVIAAFGAIALALAINRLFRGKLLAAGGSLLGGMLLLAVAGLLLVISLNLHTYDRLTYEAPVADLVFEARGPQQYHVSLAPIPSGEMQLFLLHGDEWQLDARVLKWRGWANLLGLDTQYRLERLSGRYRDIDRERNGPRTVYQLTENPGLDVWTFTQDHPGRLPFVDAVYGSATYMPMADGARYRVTMSQTGLVARPLNEAANVAAKAWK
jgi:hypothetical protein